ncbi:MAG: hypothetical protein ACYDDF_12055 [Thermoplasmatota archaeon]
MFGCRLGRVISRPCVMLAIAILGVAPLLLASPAVAQSSANAPTILPLGGGSVTISTQPSASSTACLNPTGAPSATLLPGVGTSLCIKWTPASHNGTQTLRIVLTTPSTALDNTSGWQGHTFMLGPQAANATGPHWLNVTVNGTSSAPTSGSTTISGNFTLLLGAKVSGSATGTWAITFGGTSHPPPAPLPWTLIALVALAVILAVGTSAIVAFRRRQVRAAPRSAAMRQAELEQRIEKAKPQEAQQLREEAKQQEATRTLSREASIIEAKIRDARTSLDRLQQRHEAGRLSKLQYDQMRAERETELENLEKDLDRLRRG